MDELRRDEWLAGGAVFAAGERAYGLSENGRSFCIGERAAVTAALLGGTIDARLARHLDRAGIAGRVRADGTAPDEPPATRLALYPSEHAHATVRTREHGGFSHRTAGRGKAR